MSTCGCKRILIGLNGSGIKKNVGSNPDKTIIKKRYGAPTHLDPGYIYYIPGYTAVNNIITNKCDLKLCVLHILSVKAAKNMYFLYNIHR